MKFGNILWTIAIIHNSKLIYCGKKQKLYGVNDMTWENDRSSKKYIHVYFASILQAVEKGINKLNIFPMWKLISQILLLFVDIFKE